MTQLSADYQALANYRPTHKVRFVTAASLFDGHDAAINIMRRILQSMGAEVIHLGHNRSVDEVVTAALQEDAQGIAVSSYQGGHVEYFKYMVDQLRARGGEHVLVFGGGGGVIVPSEIRELMDYGVARIYSPEDGQRMGLQGMIGEMVMRCDRDLSVYAPTSLEAIRGHTDAAWRALAQLITALESGQADPGLRTQLHEAAASARVPVLGITGTGGAGKSSLTDELIRRLRLDQDDALRIAVISIDPSRRKSGGALLGDRIRMNAISPWQQGPRVYMRSLATREAGSEISAALPDVVAACKVAGFDLVIVETSGIGQGDAAIVPHVDVPLYVMTPEFGAASQLEKIDMLDFAEFVAINKFDRKGALDALRDVAKQVQRNREAWGKRPEEMPVFGTMAARFNDDGVTALYQALLPRLAELGLTLPLGADGGRLPRVSTRHSSQLHAIVPPQRSRYLAEIADTVRAYKRRVRQQATLAREVQQLRAAAAMLSVDKPHRPKAAEAALDLAAQREQRLDADARKLLQQWPDMQKAYAGDEYVVKIRDKEIRTRLVHTTLSGNKIRKVALPKYEDHGELLRWLMLENVPGSFPYTAGVFAFKREGEDPTRMFAGEGDAFRTNRRFKLLSEGMPAKRLSTAFDSVTLYGHDPDPRPDIYGKIGNSGVSIATLDDMKVLYSGFDLCDPATSVSMTINGPAPTILAMFFNTAIDQQIDKFRADNGREPTDTEIAKIREWVLANVRGTVQADILKEDQGQNTCIFSTSQPEGDGRHPGIFRPPQRAQFLLGLDQRLPHRRGGRQPDQPARLHARQRLHLRGVVSGARHAHRRLRAQPELFLQQRHGPGVHRAGSGRAAHLGGGHARQVRGQRAQPKAQIPHPDQRAQPARARNRLQRHSHHAAGADCHLRQLQQPAHQRLRRGHHHADRGVGAPRDGDPAHHQPRMGPGQERKPQPGRVHHRRADRTGGRSGAPRVRAHRRARGRAGRDGDRLPARQNPRREHALRDAQAHR
jgi:methylmalonyl-CoA mutase